MYVYIYFRRMVQEMKEVTFKIIDKGHKCQRHNSDFKKPVSTEWEHNNNNLVNAGNRRGRATTE